MTHLGGHAVGHDASGEEGRRHAPSLLALTWTNADGRKSRHHLRRVGTMRSLCGISPASTAALNPETRLTRACESCLRIKASLRRRASGVAALHVKTDPDVGTFDQRLSFAWAAGYLEGDGSFRAKISGRWSPCVRATSNDTEPLERLRELFGGTIKPSKTTAAGNINHEWTIYGDDAQCVVAAVLPWLSARRREAALRITKGAVA